MKITREINGQKIEIKLTDEEVYLAFYTYKNKIDCEYCADYIDGMMDIYDIKEEEKEEFIDYMACLFRNYMDQGTWDIDDALGAAFEEAYKDFDDYEEEE